MQKQQELHTNESKKYSVYGPVAHIYGSSKTGSWRLERPSVDFGVCKKCGICEKFCPANIVEIRKEAKECVFIDFDYCKGCGICANECPSKCITMVPERGDE